MEGKWSSADPDPLHICHRRQRHRICGQKDNECTGHRTRLALGSYLYSTDHPALAVDGNINKHSIRTVSLFYRLYPEIGIKNGGDQRKKMKRIAVFASGAGTNAAKIVEQFRHHHSIRVSLIVCNKPDAGVLTIAATEHIPHLIIGKEKFYRGNGYADELLDMKIDMIVLAGFLWKIPSTLIKAFPGKIINIHPALLPRYGGKGMYGHHVHQAVIDNKEKESGITIHYVDEQYDHGQIIFQATCPVFENDTPGSLAIRVQQLEHEHYPKVISELAG